MSSSDFFSNRMLRVMTAGPASHSSPAVGELGEMPFASCPARAQRSASASVRSMSVSSSMTRSAMLITAQASLRARSASTALSAASRDVAGMF